MPPLILPESLNTFDRTAILPHKKLQAVYGRILDLKDFPNMGRPGRVAGTRELALAPLPFIVVYRVKDDRVEIARVLHGAQRWP